MQRVAKNMNLILNKMNQKIQSQFLTALFVRTKKEIEERFPGHSEQTQRMRAAAFKRHQKGESVSVAIRNTVEPWSVEDFLSLNEDQKKMILDLGQA